MSQTNSFKPLYRARYFPKDQAWELVALEERPDQEPSERFIAMESELSDILTYVADTLAFDISRPPMRTANASVELLISLERGLAEVRPE